jgi:hypothetical protein
LEGELVTYDDDACEITLSCSGRKFYSFGGTLHPNSDDIDSPNPTSLLYGSDGGVHCDDWTLDEREEVANHMIALWVAWRDAK